MRQILKNEKGQALAPTSMAITADAFLPIDHTEIYWLGNGGALINSRGTIIMMDPLLEGFDMPLLMKMPILPLNVRRLDAVLITHIDNDHFSVPTCQDLALLHPSYHAPLYVAEVMREKQLPGIGHEIHESFMIGSVRVTLTPAKHNWQNGSSKYQYRYWQEKDYCGYWLETPDGTIWLPGDSQLLTEQLKMPSPDVMLFDFSDNDWHITLNGAITLANTYPNTDLICIHWGCVDAPTMSPFNGNPEDLFENVINPQRVLVLAPGEKYVMKA